MHWNGETTFPTYSVDVSFKVNAMYKVQSARLDSKCSEKTFSSNRSVRSKRCSATRKICDRISAVTSPRPAECFVPLLRAGPQLGLPAESKRGEPWKWPRREIHIQVELCCCCLRLPALSRTIIKPEIYVIRDIVVIRTRKAVLPNAVMTVYVNKIGQNRY